MMRNTLVAPGSWISDHVFKGWRLTGTSQLDVAGAMSIFYVVFYHMTLFTEMLLSLCLNLDVVATIRQPFNRVHNLKYLLVTMRIGFVAILFICFYAVLHVIKLSENVTYLCTDPFDYKGLDLAKASFYVELKTWFTSYNIYITTAYSVISLMTLVMTLISYCQSSIGGMRLSKDVRDEIFRKYVLYFFVLNFMEIPNVLVVYLRFLIMNHADLDDNALRVQSYFYMWYTFRGTVLPILRLIEPQLQN